MIFRTIRFLIKKLNPKDNEALIYLIIPKLTDEQKTDLANFLIRLTEAAAKGAVEGAIKH